VTQGSLRSPYYCDANTRKSVDAPVAQSPGHPTDVPNRAIRGRHPWGATQVAG
jgi:hypothetical protein